MFRFLALSVATVALTACGTVVDKSSQVVEFEAIGARDVMCMVHTKDFKYRVFPPQKVMLKKAERDLNVDCYASGGREKKMVVETTLSPWTFGNVVDGAVPGGVYDFHTGGMFRYPEKVVVDFTDTQAGIGLLPKYEDPDAVDPRSVALEDTGAKVFAIPEDSTNAARAKMAQMKADQDAAFNAERDARRIGLEGGWNGDKSAKNADGAYAPPSGTAQSPF